MCEQRNYWLWLLIWQLLVTRTQQACLACDIWHPIWDQESTCQKAKNDIFAQPWHFTLKWQNDWKGDPQSNSVHLLWAQYFPGGCRLQDLQHGPGRCQSVAGCPRRYQDMPGHPRTCQEEPGSPGPSSVSARYPRPEMARNCDQPPQGSGGGLEALPSAQETVGEAPEPCTSERVWNGYFPLNCVGLKILKINYLDYIGALCTFILFSVCFLVKFIHRKCSHLGFHRCQHPVIHLGPDVNILSRCQHPVAILDSKCQHPVSHVC